MRDRLKKIYFTLLAPVITCFMGISLFRLFHPPIYLREGDMAIIAPTIFILSVVFAMAGPILYRSFFAHRQRNHSRISQTELFIFERTLIGISMVAPYLALGAYFLQLPRFHLAATLLAALYAIYYYYPSKKRITFDGKIFRVGDVIGIDGLR